MPSSPNLFVPASG
uniref:Uncharacterized protein n=2 Tax=Oryza TaxID=4527 RepID=A0A0E0Q830_ORYRU